MPLSLFLRTGVRIAVRRVPLALVLWSVGLGIAAAAGDTRLVEAARQQDLQAARALVHQVDVNAAPVNGATALHWAAHWDNLELAHVLLQAGADPSLANDYGVTSLWLACTNGSVHMVRALLDAGANPWARLATGESVLMTASRTGNVDVVRLLLSAGADPNVTEDYRGQTALMWAIAEGHHPIVRALLDAGADVHARTKAERDVSAVGAPKSRGGSTPLIFAARRGDIAVAELLVSRGARINETPADDGSTPLLVATVRGHVELAEWLLQRGADPNVAAAGYTPLHWAVGVWESLVTDYALEGDEEWKNLKGIPTEEQRVRLARALLAHGADPNARVTGSIPRFGGGNNGGGSGNRAIERGATPYLIAAMSGEAKLMRLLAAARADTKFRGGDDRARGSGAEGTGVTALLAAAGQGHTPGISTVPEARHLEAVKAALELGADVNETNALGFTALHAAVYVGFANIIEFLAAQGANVNQADERGRTPLDVAEEDTFAAQPFSQPEAAAALLKVGARQGTCTPPPDERVPYCSSERFRGRAYKDVDREVK